MLLCNPHHHPSSELFSSLQTRSLYPLNTNSSFPPPAPDNHLSTFSVWIWPLWVLEISGIIQGLSLCVWLISLSTKSSRFSHAHAFNSCMISCRCTEKPQHGWGWGLCGSSQHPQPRFAESRDIFLVLKNAVPLNSETTVWSHSPCIAHREAY